MTIYQLVQIIESKGRIELSEVPFNAPTFVPCALRVQKNFGEIERIEVETCNQYTIQGDLFAKAFVNETPVPTPIVDAIHNMNTLEAIFASGKSGGWVVSNQT